MNVRENHQGISLAVARRTGRARLIEISLLDRLMERIAVRRVGRSGNPKVDRAAPQVNVRRSNRTPCPAFAMLVT